MLRFLFLVIILISSNPQLHSIYNYRASADKIINTLSQELYDTRELSKVGSGGSFYDDLKQVSAFYECTDQLTMESARELLIEIVEKYVKALNSNLALRPFLHNYPAGSNNVLIGIGFVNAKPATEDNHPLSNIVNKGDEIIFFYLDHNNNQKILTIESYAEAQTKMRNIVDSAEKLNRL